MIRLQNASHSRIEIVIIEVNRDTFIVLEDDKEVAVDQI